MELWRDIPEYEGLYQASNMGGIRTCEGKTTENARFAQRVWKQRVLKPKYEERRSNPKHKDKRVELWRGAEHKTHLVARLVARAWCAGYVEGLTVNHIDGNPLNNRADNLEWVTRAENIRKAFEAGLYSTQKAVSLIDAQGNKLSFASLARASKFLGKNAGYISAQLAKGCRVLPSGYVIAD